MSKCTRCHGYWEGQHRTCDRCRVDKQEYRATHRDELADYMIEYRARKAVQRDMEMWRQAFSLGAGLL